MRPHWRFALNGALIASGAVLALMTLLFIISFVLFILRANGILFVPIFGWRGIGVFIRSLPWILIFISLVIIVILELLVRHYSFAYRRPLLYSAAVTVLLVSIGGIAIDRATLHERFFEQARYKHLPIAEKFYQEYGEQRFRDIHIGAVVELNEDGLIIRNRRGENLNVAVTAETRLPLGSDFQPNDRLVIFGERDGNNIQAFGIRRVDAGEENFRYRGQGRTRPPFFRQMR